MICVWRRAHWVGGLGVLRDIAAGKRSKGRRFPIGELVACHVLPRLDLLPGCDRKPESATNSGAQFHQVFNEIPAVMDRRHHQLGSVMAELLKPQRSVHAGFAGLSVLLNRSIKPGEVSNVEG